MPVLKKTMTSTTEKKYGLITAILILAAFLRILGIWHGYPYSFYPDEAHFVKRALSFGSLDFNPHWFHKPAFYMYVLFFEYGVYYVIGKIAGLWSTVSDFAVSYVKNPGPFYIIGRITTVLFSLGSILAVYRIGERYFKPGTGIVAALLLCLSFGHVAASQDIKADTPAMFCAIISMLFLLGYVKDYKLSNLILASILAGVGTATKIYSCVMLVPIVIGIIVVQRETAVNIGQKMHKIIFYGCIVLIIFFTAFFICSPYHFLDPLGRQATFGFIDTTVEKINHLFGAEKTVDPESFLGERAGLFEGSISYIKVLLATKGMGIIAGISFVGLVYLLSHISKQVFIFLTYPVLFTGISIYYFPGYAEPRHQLPIYPFLVVCGGTLIAAVAGKEGLRKKIAIAILLLSLAHPLYKIIERDIHVARLDTRNLAKTWIESNIPSGAKLLMDNNGPQLLTSDKFLKEKMARALKANPSGQFTAHYGTLLNYQLLAAKDSITYDIEFIRIQWWREKEEQPGVYYATSEYDLDMGNPLKAVGVMPYRFYKKNGYDYIIVTSDKYRTFLENDSQKSIRYPSFHKFYKTLFENGLLIKEFRPEIMKSHGPIVKIFKVS